MQVHYEEPDYYYHEHATFTGNSYEYAIVVPVDVEGVVYQQDDQERPLLGLPEVEQEGHTYTDEVAEEHDELCQYHDEDTRGQVYELPADTLEQGQGRTT